jgi:glycosyltransferase involved in cell wall biosynthesis
MSTKPTTVSVITPCYNGSAFLAATLQSVLSQTQRPLEIIVVDDGSTDNSAAIAEAFGPPVRVLRQTNQGESVARNRGIAEARGTHVLFLDADDLLAPEALEHLTRALDDQSGAVALMGCAWFEEDPAAPYGVLESQRRAFFPAMIESNFAPPHSWLAPIELIRRVGGFYESLRWFEDWDMWWRVGLQNPELIPVDYVGALYRRHAGSQLATTKLADRARGHACLMERMATAFLARPDLVKLYGDQLFWSSWTALARARAQGVGWDELEDLMAALRVVVRQVSPRTARSRVAATLRLFGPRVAVWLDHVITLGRNRAESEDGRRGA